MEIHSFAELKRAKFALLNIFAMMIIFIACVVFISNSTMRRSINKEIEVIHLNFEISNLGDTSSEDTIPTFKVDDYPVTDSMFKMGINKLKAAGLASDDQIWFINDSLRETLVFDIYTDYYRVNTYHFLNDDIPEELIKKISIYTGDGQYALKENKQQALLNMQKNAPGITKNYFTSNKGFSLRDSKNKAIETYGYPDTINVINGVEKLRWNFIGDIYYYDHKIDLKAKPLAENSFGHSITMFFREERLIGMLLENDVP